VEQRESPEKQLLTIMALAVWDEAATFVTSLASIGFRTKSEQSVTEVRVVSGLGHRVKTSQNLRRSNALKALVNFLTIEALS